MDAGHTFRSVIAHSICASIQGNHHSQSLCHIHALPILSFFFLAFRTIRLCCTPSSLWGRWRSKTDQCRPSEPFAPAFELDNGSMRPSHSPYTPQLQLFVWPLTSFLWAFDVNGVARRSLACDWIRDCTWHDECERVIARRRGGAAGAGADGVVVRNREVLPQWSDLEAKALFCEYIAASLEHCLSYRLVLMVVTTLTQNL